jgi:hypothetical protein
MLLAYFRYFIIPLSPSLILSFFLISEIPNQYNYFHNYQYAPLKTKRSLKNAQIEREINKSLPPI